VPDYIANPHKAVSKLKSRFTSNTIPMYPGRVLRKFVVPSPSQDWAVPEYANSAPKFMSNKRTYPPIPPAIVKTVGKMTEPEWAIYWALGKQGAQFVFQQSFWYGRKQVGGAVADFTVYSPVTIVIRVQGEYWHYGMGSEKIENDLFQKMRFAADGFPCIDIDEIDATTSPMYYTKEALLGIDHSKGGRN
jgi:hypothetical protein